MDNLRVSKWLNGEAMVFVVQRNVYTIFVFFLLQLNHGAWSSREGIFSKSSRRWSQTIVTRLTLNIARSKPWWLSPAGMKVISLLRNKIIRLSSVEVKCRFPEEVWSLGKVLVMRLLPFSWVSEAKIIINLPLLPKLLAQPPKKDFI